MHDDNDLARKLAHLSATFAYMTLRDGVLLDVEFDAVDGRLVLRAGTSLTPAERPEVLRLTFMEFGELVSHAISLFVGGMRKPDKHTYEPEDA